MNKIKFEEMLYHFKQTNHDFNLPNKVIKIIVDNFTVWQGLDDKDLTYDKMCADSMLTGEFPTIDNDIYFYGNMTTLADSLEAVIGELFELSKGFCLPFSICAKSHHIAYLERDNFFILLY